MSLRRRAAAAPLSVAELLSRAEGLAGCQLRELAALHACPVPEDLRRDKGWVGQLLELALGATGGSRAVPDFPELQVELKTLPVNRAGRSLESTFVCTIELLDSSRLEWETSWVRQKLSRVLWVPVLGERAIAPGDRVLGTPFLWSPSPAEEAALREDFEELCGLMGRGQIAAVDARMGRVLQVRPKARYGASRRRALDDEGALYDEQPKGFYLRASFTQSIVASRLRLPGV